MKYIGTGQRTEHSLILNKGCLWRVTDMLLDLVAKANNMTWKKSLNSKLLKKKTMYNKQKCWILIIYFVAEWVLNKYRKKVKSTLRCRSIHRSAAPLCPLAHPSELTHIIGTLPSCHVPWLVPNPYFQHSKVTKWNMNQHFHSQINNTKIIPKTTL